MGLITFLLLFLEKYINLTLIVQVIFENKFMAVEFSPDTRPKQTKIQTDKAKAPTDQSVFVYIGPLHQQHRYIAPKMSVKAS